MEKTRREKTEFCHNNPFTMKSLMFFRQDARNASWRVLFYVVGIVIVLLLPFPRKEQEWTGSSSQVIFQLAQALIIGPMLIAGWIQFYYRVYIGLKLTYLGFYQRILVYELEREIVPIDKPSLRYILFKDLEVYEDELRAYVRYYRRNLDQWIKEEKWSKASWELTKQLENLLRQFPLESTERAEIFERWEGMRNPKGKKKYLSHLQSEFLRRQFSQNNRPLA